MGFWLHRWSDSSSLSALSTPFTTSTSTSAFSSTYYLSRTFPHPLNSMMDTSYGIAQFADDTGFWFSSTQTRHLVRNLTQIFDDLLGYCNKWRIQLNTAKTTLLLLIKCFRLTLTVKFQDDPFILGLYPQKLSLPVLHWTLHSTSKCTSHQPPLLEPWTTGTKSAPPASRPHFTPQPLPSANHSSTPSQRPPLLLSSRLREGLFSPYHLPPWTANAELYDQYSIPTSTT